MKQSISKCLGFLADNEYQGEVLDESTRCRIGQIVCKAVLREDETDWYSEHGGIAAGPGDIIAALYHWGHDHSEGQWSETYALGCAAGAIYSPGMGGLEPDSMEESLYLDWTYSGKELTMSNNPDYYSIVKHPFNDNLYILTYKGEKTRVVVSRGLPSVDAIATGISLHKEQMCLGK